MNSTSRVDESEIVYELRERIRDLEKLVGLSWAPPRALGLSPMQSKLLGVLLKHRTQCTYEAIMTALYGEREDPPGVEVIRAHVTHIRRLLDPHGIQIKRLWGSGYYITPEHIAKLNALYEPGELAEAA